MPFLNKRLSLPHGDRRLDIIANGSRSYAVFEYNQRTVVLNQQTGLYEYARLERGELVPSGVVADDASPEQLESIPLHLRADRAVIKQKLRGCCTSHEFCRWRQRWVESKVPEGIGLLLAPPQSKTLGQIVGLCLVVQFKDVATQISRDEVDKFCNQQGYNANGNNGSVYDYFFDISGGRVQYTTIVPPIITLSKDKAYYTDKRVEMPYRTYELIKEAIGKLPSDLHLSTLTTDGRGYVKALNIFYAGEVDNNFGEGLWPHSFHLGSPIPIGGFRQRLFYDYQITNLGSVLQLGTFCHENGHMICDFPDLYDPGYQSTGCGLFCVMAVGSNANELDPGEPCAYLKFRAGWGENLYSGPGEFTLKRNEFYLYRRNPTEYFILEARFSKGRDTILPGSGLAIWHIDEAGDNENEQMSPRMHYECSLEQADGQYDLERNRDYGDVTDLFTDGTAFNHLTTPSSAWWDGTKSGFSVSSIKVNEDEGTVSFVVGLEYMEEMEATKPPPFVLTMKDPSAAALSSSVTQLSSVGLAYKESCEGGDSYENNSAHFLADAFIRAGFTELAEASPHFNARCASKRPIRARDLWSWFKSKAVKTSRQPQKNTGWWAVFQLKEGQYYGGHVVLLDSNNWVYYGTGWYPDWDQYLYQW